MIGDGHEYGTVRSYEVQWRIQGVDLRVVALVLFYERSKQV